MKAAKLDRLTGATMLPMLAARLVRVELAVRSARLVRELPLDREWSEAGLEGCGCEWACCCWDDRVL